MVPIRPSPGAKRRARRKGIGIAAGQGKTCGRGMKGQRARERVRPGFEGGQLPLHRRLPQLRGVGKKARNLGIFRREWACINLARLDCLELGSEITPQLLLEHRVVKKLGEGLKVLGQGELSKPLTIRAHKFSRSALEKIQRAGGQAVRL